MNNSPTSNSWKLFLKKGYDWSGRQMTPHVAFGLVIKNGKKLTRKGNVIWLVSTIAEAVNQLKLKSRLRIQTNKSCCPRCWCRSYQFYDL